MPRDERVEVEVSSDDAEGSKAKRRVSRKRTQGLDGTQTKRYAPNWVIYPRDSVISRAPEPTRMLEGHICRGMALPKDRVAMASVDPVSACTELMASLAFVLLIFSYVHDSRSVFCHF